MRAFLLALAGMIAVSALGGLMLSRHASGLLGEWAQDGGFASDLGLAGATTGSGGGGQVLYQYVDESGSVQFVDDLEQVPERWRDDAGRIELAATSSSPRRSQPAARAAARPFAVASHDVVMYSSPGCHACESAANWFARHDVPYTELDIRSEEARERLEGRVGRWATPTIDVDGQLVIGFDPNRLGELLDL